MQVVQQSMTACLVRDHLKPLHIIGKRYACVCYRASGGNDYWLGLKKSSAAVAASCYWVDGNPSTFRDWETQYREPNENVECVRMHSSGTFRDRACSKQYRYVCKGISLLIRVFYVIINETWRTF